MNGNGILDPLVPLVVLYALAALVCLGLVFAVWRRLLGWALRALAAVVILGAIANPSLQQEDRAEPSDIVLAVVDESASQRLPDRPDPSAPALANLQAEVARRPNQSLILIS